ncbi:MAG TPA: DUF885 domain-containing protein [Xanthomonadales bacterium]|nr:DUF885 domain-containing protein [Xanthomonadales bacterium]
MKKTFVSVLCPGLLIAACFSGPQVIASEAAANPAQATRDLADRYYAFRLQSQPEIAYFSGVELERHDGLTDNSAAGQAAIQREEDAMWQQLQAIDAEALQGTVDWITWGILQQSLQSAREIRVCRYPAWAVSQMAGWQMEYAQLASLQPVGTEELRDQALARWSRMPVFIDQEIVNLQAGLAAGYSAPQAAVRRVIAQLDGLLAMLPADSPFASPAQRDDDEGFSGAFVELVANGINPAIQRYRDYLQTDYLPKAREALAVTANPDGRACYDAALRSYTTLDRTGEQVFELGMDTVTTNKAKVQELGAEAYDIDEFAAIIQHIKDDPKDKFSNAEELLQYSKDAVSRAEAAMPQWFGYVPAVKAEVVPFPEYQEGTGVSARYEPGNESRPGMYRIPLYQPEKQSKGNAESTAFHEVWPGHHMQVAVAQEIKGLHPVSRITWYSGFGEGWARYSEGLAVEMGLYHTKTGPISRLAWPARGMVVDPGIHLLGWSREQAIAFMAQAGRMSDTELDDMVDRIAVLPGQLTAYDSGGLEILALRRLSTEKLGSSFDIREFHDEILKNGTIPLTMLRTHIETWLQQAETQPGAD